MDKSCHVEPKETTIDFTQLDSDYTAYFNVQGMGCPNCASRVKNGLLELEGVHMAAVYLHENVASVVYDPYTNTTEELEEVIFNAGNDGRHLYQAQLLRVIESPTILNG